VTNLRALLTMPIYTYFDTIRPVFFSIKRFLGDASILDPSFERKCGFVRPSRHLVRAFFDSVRGP
jgi:hypothetical protein